LTGTLAAVKKGDLPSVKISVERRQGNKKVTCIVGVEPFLLDAHAIAAAAQVSGP
jgi:translation initiation factor 2D